MAITCKGGFSGGNVGTTSSTLNCCLTTNWASAGVTLAEGDLVIGYIATGSTTTDKTFTTASSGWTKLVDVFSNGSTDTNFAVFYKFIGATPDSSLLLSQGSNSSADAITWAWLAFSGVDPSTPIDVATVTATGADTTRPNPPSITPSTVGATVLALGGGATPAASDLTNPGAYSNFFQARAADTNDSVGFIGVHTASWASGAVDPPAATGGTGNVGVDTWAAASVALRPDLRQTLTASLLTNSNTFYGPSIATLLSPILFTNTNTFLSPVVTSSITLSPNLLTDGDTLYSPTVSTQYNLAPSLLTSGIIFYDPTVIPGAVTLTPAFFINDVGDGTGNDFFQHEIARLPIHGMHYSFRLGKPRR